MTSCTAGNAEETLHAACMTWLDTARAYSVQDRLSGGLTMMEACAASSCGQVPEVDPRLELPAGAAAQAVRACLETGLEASNG
jgi:hypothetical protein